MKNLLLILALTISISAQESVLTNESVIELTKAGLPTSVIVTKIKNSETNFDTQLSALKLLTESGVNESVISAMIEAAASKLIDEKAEQAKPAPAETPKTEPTPVKVARPNAPTFTRYNQLDKASQKERLKAPARIQIAAPASTVSTLLITAFQSWDYQIESESDRSLMMSKPVSGIGNQMLLGMAIGGNNMRYKIQVSIAEFQGISSVIVSAWATSQNAFGKTTEMPLNKNKKWRVPLDDLLYAVKNRAESVIP